MSENEGTVQVRLMKRTDIDAVLELAGSLITREEIASVNPGGPNSYTFVAEADGKVVGFNLSNIYFVGIPLTKVCVVQGIVVHHEYRRHGIGEKLTEAIVERCQERGINTIRALVEEGDARLRQFAEQLGFRRSTVANYDKII